MLHFLYSALLYNVLVLQKCLYMLDYSVIMTLNYSSSVYH